MKVTVVHNGDALLSAIDELGKAINPKLLTKATRRALNVTLRAVRRSTMEHLSIDPTGGLARSWEIELDVRGKAVSGGVRSGAPHARIHNDGGEIRPKKGKFLAIPIARDIPRGQRARDDPTDMQVLPTKKGGFMLADVGRGEVKPRWLLVKRVRIKATKYIDISVKASEAKTIEALKKVVTDALQAAAEESSE